MGVRSDLSDYLKSSILSHFGREKGEKIAELLRKSGVVCFDDLARGLPEGLADLAGISLEEFNRFLEEYGPQAIFRMRNKLAEAEKRIKELEVQIEWAKKQLFSRSVERGPSGRGKAVRALRLALIKLNVLIGALEFNYREQESIGQSLIDEELLEIVHDLREASKELRSGEPSQEVLRLAQVLEDFYDMIREEGNSVTAGDTKSILIMTTSLISDVIASLSLGRGGECTQLTLENAMLKSELIALKVREMRGWKSQPML